MEPFGDSMPEILKDHGVHTHLVTGQYHYFEDGGATYHTRYRSYERPLQLHPLNDPEQETRMCGLMQRLMKESYAPAEQFVRMGFEKRELRKSASSKQL